MKSSNGSNGNKSNDAPGLVKVVEFQLFNDPIKIAFWFDYARDHIEQVIAVRKSDDAMGSQFGHVMIEFLVQALVEFSYGSKSIQIDRETLMEQPIYDLSTILNVIRKTVSEHQED